MLLGDYEKSPFDFRRSWEVDEVSVESRVTSREENLERAIRELHEKIGRLENHFEREQQGSSLFGRIIRPSTSAASEQPPSYEQSIADDPPEPPVVAKKTIFIRKVELSLNGVPIGSFKPISRYAFSTLLILIATSTHCK